MDGIGHYQQALAIAQETGDRRGEGIVQYNLGLALAGVGERAAAIECMERALEIFKQIQSPFAERVRAQLAQWRQEG